LTAASLEMKNPPRFGALAYNFFRIGMISV
jgi:hypothetical protein